jgi:predicted dithiol-disulfide oxidoreductase (DUF899 family)
MLVIYRGLHCPICKTYLGQLNDMKGDFDKMNVQIVAASTDPEEKANKFASELGLNFEVAYGLGIDQARDLGLYISTPLDSTETDQPFSEPGFFSSVRMVGCISVKYPALLSVAPISR